MNIAKLRKFEGHEVEVNLDRGGYISDALLVSAVGGRTQSVWLEVDGEDLFLPIQQVRSLFPRSCSNEG